ncbi:MAG: hypothetical protein ACREDR_26510 [Blastocatellia bacterium]
MSELQAAQPSQADNARELLPTATPDTLAQVAPPSLTSLGFPRRTAPNPNVRCFLCYCRLRGPHATSESDFCPDCLRIGRRHGGLTVAFVHSARLQNTEWYGCASILYTEGGRHTVSGSIRAAAPLLAEFEAVALALKNTSPTLPALIFTDSEPVARSFHNSSFRDSLPKALSSLIVERTVIVRRLPTTARHPDQQMAGSLAGQVRHQLKAKGTAFLFAHLYRKGETGPFVASIAVVRGKTQPNYITTVCATNNRAAEELTMFKAAFKLIPEGTNVLAVTPSGTQPPKCLKRSAKDLLAKYQITWVPPSATDRLGKHTRRSREVVARARKALERSGTTAS